MKQKLTFIIAIWILFFATSCGVFNLGKKTKLEKETTTKITDFRAIKKDSTSTVVKEVQQKEQTIAPIQKSNSISLKTADSLTNIKINQALRNFKFYDRSGGNSVTAKYDEKTMQLLIEAFVAGTSNKDTKTNTDTNTNTNNETTTDTSLEQTVEETSRTIIKMIPLWVWLIAAVWFLPQILSRLKLLYNPISTLLSRVVK